jgi:hypothetical protein
MGLEFISQPQVFTQRLTALGGVEGYVPPLWSTFYTWTSTLPITANELLLDGTNALTDYSGSYIVTVGGVLQSPTTYNIDVINRSIIFDTIINEDTDVVITQIGTIGLTSLGFQELSAVDATFDTLTANTLTANELFVSNLTALSSVLHITDITTYEVSGFDVQGSINVQDDVTVGNTLYTYYLSADDASITNLDTNTITTNTLSSSVTFIDTLDVNTGTVDILDVNTSTVNNLSADTAHITSPILSTDNSTQFATTNFVRQFGGFQNMAVYTSGTGTVDLSSLGEGIEKIKVTVVGGGGGGGGTLIGAAGRVGGGGGSGGMAIGYITNISNLGTSFTYNVGVGGPGVNGENGLTGANSTFTLGSVVVTGNGGEGGVAGTGTTNAAGGLGGTASGGQVNKTGNAGDQSIYASATVGQSQSGRGGSTFFGPGGDAKHSFVAAQNFGHSAEPNTGSGGGGSATSTSANTTGGNGGSGIIIVEW